MMSSSASSRNGPDTNAAALAIANMSGTALNDLDEDDEFMWTSAPFSPSVALNRGLKEWEASLRCAICGAFMRVPVSVQPCHHSFCSCCIREAHKKCLSQGTNRTARCPSCKDVLERDVNRCLVPNRALAEAIKGYVALRGGLRDALAQTVSCPNQPSDAGVAAKGEDVLDGEDLSDDGPLRRSTRSATRNSDESRAPSEHAAASNIAAVGTNKPVEKPAERKERLRKKAKAQYHGLKKKQLVELCAKEGLSTRGSDQELRARHEEYITLYNAECDSFTPRSPAELAREIDRRERARKEEARQSMLNGNSMHTACVERLKESRKALGDEKSSVTEVSSGNAAFDSKLNAGFKELKKLIAETQKRKGVKRKNPPADNEKDGCDGSNEDARTSFSQSTMALADPMASQGTADGSSHYLESTPDADTTHSVGSVDFTTRNGSGGSEAATRSTPVDRPPTNKAPVLPFSNQKSSKTRKGSPPTRIAWKCDKCTFLNEKHNWTHARCEMCQTPRQEPSPNERKEGKPSSSDKEDKDCVILVDC